MNRRQRIKATHAANRAAAKAAWKALPAEERLRRNAQSIASRKELRGPVSEDPPIRKDEYLGADPTNMEGFE